jgi:hypothetical protein
LASVAVNFDGSTGTPVVAVAGALTEIDGVQTDDRTTVDAIAGLQREFRARFDESPVNCAYHQ